MLNKIIKEDIKEIIKITGNELFALEGKSILITGASGMLTSYIVYVINYLNDHRFKNKTKLYLLIRHKTEKFGKKRYIKYLNYDVSKKFPGLPNIDYIIHAASKSAPKLYTKNMVDTLNANIKGLYNVLDMVNSKTKSIVYFSSAEVYGQPDIDRPINENYIGRSDHLNERSCYVEGKKAGETICINYFMERKYPIKILRFFHTFGPGLNLDDGRVFSDFIRDGVNKKNILILGNKNIKKPILYLKDATIMTLKILLSDKNGQVYNIANDKNIVSVFQMAFTVKNIINESSVKKIKVKINKSNNKYYKHAVKLIIPDISKFIKDFHYHPTTDTRTAFYRTIKSLR